MGRQEIEEENFQTKIQLDVWTKLILEKIRVIPMIATLLAMLLIVASFNENILPVNNGLRILIICTLVFVFISLCIYIIILTLERKGIETHLDKNITEEGRKKIQQKDFFHYFEEYSPYVLLFVLAVIIVFIIYFISCNFENASIEVIGHTENGLDNAQQILKGK